MTINYVNQMVLFYDWLSVNQHVGGHARLMYYSLVNMANKGGWQRWVQVGNGRMKDEIDAASDETLFKARDQLVEEGLIDYRKGKRGCPPKYHIFPLERRKDGSIYMLNDLDNTPIKSVEYTTNTPTNNQVINGQLQGQSTDNNQCNSEAIVGAINFSSIDSNNIYKTKQDKTKLNNTKRKGKRKSVDKTHKPKNNHGVAVSDFEDKTVYGELENVWLKDLELQKLKERYPTRYQEMIDKLSNYKASKPKGYASDYATIIQWINREEKNKTNNETVSDERLECIETLTELQGQELLKQYMGQQIYE